MFEVFQQYLKSKASLTDEEIERVRSVSIVKKLRKKQYLLQEGQVWKSHAFITSGCMRKYSVDGKGVEHIIYFGVENWWIGDRESLLSAGPSRYNIDAVEDAEVVIISKADFDLLCREIPAFNAMILAIMDKSFVVWQNRLHDSISYSAEEKYLHFLDKYAAFANRIPQHMIASYLGMTAETLSRIRKGVAGK